MLRAVIARGTWNFFYFSLAFTLLTRKEKRGHACLLLTFDAQANVVPIKMHVPFSFFKRHDRLPEKTDFPDCTVLPEDWRLRLRQDSYATPRPSKSKRNRIVLRKRLRAIPIHEDEILTAVLESINGIAAGLKNTG
jgi:hypothetical protein